MLDVIEGVWFVVVSSTLICNKKQYSFDALPMLGKACVICIWEVRILVR